MPPLQNSAVATREGDRECAVKPRRVRLAAQRATIGILPTTQPATMRLSTVPAIAGLLLAVFASTSLAADTPPLHTELTLTHVAADKWRADYVFAEPVTALDFGPQIGPYRQQAWRPLTAGVTLVADGGNEGLRTSGKPLRALSIEIDAYSAFAEKQYSPIDRFSDGGSDFYLGFLFASLKQGERERDMEVNLRLQGMPGETVIAPAKPGKEMAGYAYFGPGKPERAGIVNVIIDPQTPTWLREVLFDTTSRVSQFYEQAFERKLLATPLVSVAVVGFEGAPGKLSIKGGAVGGGIAYRLEGDALRVASPKRRQYIARVIAHEMAHLWQQNLSQGGIGEAGEPWVHEGGAEAIMLTALRATGVLTAEESDLAAQGLLAECATLKDDVSLYRGMYACGFKRFQGYKVAPIPLWKSMMASSEASGAVYSEKMIQTLLEGAATKP
jgi:hypothetical protein